MRKLSVLMVVWVLASAVGIAQAESAGFLQAKDTRIVDGQGREVVLRGIGLPVK
jgi:hypothetical protein